MAFCSVILDGSLNWKSKPGARGRRETSYGAAGPDRNRPKSSRRPLKWKRAQGSRLVASDAAFTAKPQTLNPKPLGFRTLSRAGRRPNERIAANVHYRILSQAQGPQLLPGRVHYLPSGMQAAMVQKNTKSGR